MTKQWFQEFMNYKDLVADWRGNYAEAPLDRLVLYNCGDCDITKRIEAKTVKHVNSALMQVYIHVAFVLDAMEKRGPILDWKAHERLTVEIPKIRRPIDLKLKQLSGRPDFNPGAPPQIAWLLYDKLKLPQLEEWGRSTKDDALSILAQETQHPAPNLVRQRRALATIESTFCGGYAASAKLNGGELRTIWWLTGAATGRLRSGKSGQAEIEGVCNFQNIHGNPIVQLMLVSDKNWRLALESK